MTFRLYNCSSDKTDIIKSLSETTGSDGKPLGSIYGNITDNCSIINPVFMFDFAGNNYPNYLYCDDFKRYYFIDDIIMGGKGNIRYFACSVDPLMSFSEHIKNIDTIAVRNENTWDETIPDDSFPVSSDKQIIQKEFGDPIIDQIGTYYIVGIT